MAGITEKMTYGGVWAGPGHIDMSSSPPLSRRMLSNVSWLTVGRIVYQLHIIGSPGYVRFIIRNGPDLRVTLYKGFQ